MAFPPTANSTRTGKVLLLARMLTLLFSLVIFVQAQTDRGPEGVLVFNEQLRSATEAGATPQGSRRRPVRELQQAEHTRQLLERRAKALERLMRENPAAAKSVALSESERQALLLKQPGAADLIEMSGTWSGQLEVFVADDEALSARTIGFLHTDEDTIEVSIGRLRPELHRGGYASVTGIRLGGIVAADSVELFPVAEISAEGQSANAGTCSTVGEQRSAVLVVRFPETDLGFGVAEIQESFFGPSDPSLNGYLRDASYGKAWLSGQAVGPYTLNGPYTCSQLALLRQDAITAAAGDVNFLAVERLFVVTPNMGCGWAGFASSPCGQLTSPAGSFSATTAYLRADLMLPRQRGVELVTHEAGHNLGLSHSGTRDFGNDALGPQGATGEMREFDDWFSTMGVWGLGHYNAPHKAGTLGWLTEGASMQTVQQSGSFTLRPYSDPALGLKALKILREPGTNSWLWAEFRQPIGAYDSTIPATTFSSQVFSGVLLHYWDSNTGYATHLLDFTPHTSQWTDPALTSGASWSDPYGPLRLTVGSATAAALELTVDYGTTPCNTSPPLVSMTPDAAPVQPGTNVQFTVSVQNLDSSGCESSTFSLDSTEPAGWGQTFSSPALSVPPGSTRSTMLSMPIPGGLSSGQYPVNARAQHGPLLSVDTATVNVMACVNTAPSLTVSPANREMAPGEAVSFNVFVTNNNDSAACGSGIVALALTSPPGWSSSVSPSSLTILPGQTASAALVASAPSAALSGSYAIGVSATQSGVTVSRSALILVVAPRPIEVSLSVPQTSYLAKEVISATASVHDAGLPLAGATVTFALIGQDGSVLAEAEAVANGQGTAVWQYLVPNNVRAGAYILSGSASAGNRTGAATPVELQLGKSASPSDGGGTGGKGKGGPKR